MIHESALKNDQQLQKCQWDLRIISVVLHSFMLLRLQMWVTFMKVKPLLLCIWFVLYPWWSCACQAMWWKSFFLSLECLKRMLNLNEVITNTSVAEPVWKVCQSGVRGKTIRTDFFTNYFVSFFLSSLQRLVVFAPFFV